MVEAEFEMMQLEVKDCWQPLETGKRQRKDSPLDTPEEGDLVYILISDF